jgi:hypothetical protein
MQSSGVKTYQYCEYLDTLSCPYFIVSKRQVSSPACNQFRPLKDVAMFKERRKLDEFVLVKKQPIKKDKKLKRHLDF